MTSSGSRREEARAEYLTFFVEGEEYAVPLMRVREVMPYETLTRVPQLPRAIRGVTNLRGNIVAVVDLARKLLDGETPVTARTCIVMVDVLTESGPAALGLMTEAVGQVLALAAHEILPPPSFGAPVRTEHLLGLGLVGKKFALLLDLDALLATDELLAADEAARPEPPVAPAPGPEIVIEAEEPA